MRSQNPEYHVWERMRQRCGNPKRHGWNNYGGRGIECRFPTFAEFLEHVGPRPTPQHTIDRIDNDGHYERGNVRWATREEQNRNRRSNVLNESLVAQIRELRSGGLSIRKISAKLGLDESTVGKVISGRTWSTDDAHDAERWRMLDQMMMDPASRLSIDHGGWLLIKHTIDAPDGMGLFATRAEKLQQIAQAKPASERAPCGICGTLSDNHRAGCTRAHEVPGSVVADDDALIASIALAMGPHNSRRQELMRALRARLGQSPEIGEPVPLSEWQAMERGLLDAQAENRRLWAELQEARKK